MSDKSALIIGVSHYYDDPQLARLVAPAADVSALGDVLQDPEIGGFSRVTPLVDPSAQSLRLQIEEFFSEQHPDDLTLMYFSGHGVRDDVGHLYLATSDSRHNRLRATAVPATFITGEMDRSRSRRQVLVLDCCHSGAFEHGAKASTGESVGTSTAFAGKGFGRVVLTASDATQYAWEGERLIGSADRSVFTHYLVEGLKSGAADRDGDGWITLDELYDYVYEQVLIVTPKQTPGKWSYKQQGDIVVARNPHPVTRVAKLPPELQDLIESPLPAAREASVHELERLLQSSNPSLAAAALAQIERLLQDDSRRVASAAAEVLASHGQSAGSRTLPTQPQTTVAPGSGTEVNQPIAPPTGDRTEPAFGRAPAASRAALPDVTPVPQPASSTREGIPPTVRQPQRFILLVSLGFAAEGLLVGLLLALLGIHFLF